MKVGYIRVSSKDQNATRQIQALKEYGCEKLFIDKKSGKDLNRQEYFRMKNFVREKDIVVFAELDRLGRKKEDIDREWNDLIQKGIDIVVLDMPILDTTKYQDELGKVMLNMAREILSYVAEQDRLKILERQRQGIKIAKEEGKYTGTKTLYTADSKNANHRRIFYLVSHMLHEKKPILQIANEVGISRNTVYRIQKDIKSDNHE